MVLGDDTYVCKRTRLHFDQLHSWPLVARHKAARHRAAKAIRARHARILGRTAQQAGRGFPERYDNQRQNGKATQ